MLTSFGKKVEVFLFWRVKRSLNDVWDRTVQRYFTVKNKENERKKNENELQMSEAFFSFRGIRGTFLIYVYIHFQYFPAEKLIVHVNGYFFRFSFRKSAKKTIVVQDSYK